MEWDRASQALFTTNNIQLMTSYKEEKEAFVSGLEGTSIGEILLVSTSVPLGLLLLSEFSKAFPKNGTVQFIVEVCCLLIPTLACLLRPELAGSAMAATLLAYSLTRLATLGRLGGTISTSTVTAKSQEATRGSGGGYGSFCGRLPFITHFRGGIMLITCISILAVDFPAFPRRLAKTETYGTGLMDLGAGCIVFSSSVVIGASYSGTKKRKESDGSVSSPKEQRRRTIPALGWWLLLGLAVSRFAVVKLLSYQEHVTEYGVHWNFFATLIVVRSFLGWARGQLSVSQRMGLAILLMLCHEVFLSRGGKEFMLSAPRDNFISQNREGIFGTIGYSCISLVGEALSHGAIWHPKLNLGSDSHNSQKEHFRHQLTSCMRLLKSGALCMLYVWAAEKYLEIPISRRLANSAYVMWCCAHCSLLLALMSAVDVVSGWTARSIILEALNSNMLVVFLIANVLTGVVNMFIRTLYVSDEMAFLILLVYLLVVVMVAVQLDRAGVRVRS